MFLLFMKLYQISDFCIISVVFLTDVKVMKYTPNLTWLCFEVLKRIQLFFFRQSLDIKAIICYSAVTLFWNELREHYFFLYFMNLYVFSKFGGVGVFLRHGISKGWWKNKNFGYMRLSCSVCKAGHWIQPISQQTGWSITETTFLLLILIAIYVAVCSRTNAKD